MFSSKLRKLDRGGFRRGILSTTSKRVFSVTEDILSEEDEEDEDEQNGLAKNNDNDCKNGANGSN